MTASERPIPFISEIEYCFQPDSIINIYERLYEVSEGVFPDLSPEFADSTLKQLANNSPLSMVIIVEQMKRGAEMNLQDVYKMEFKICQGFMSQGEFFEGIRALIAEKDLSPKWRHSKIDEVTSQDIEYFFNRKEKINLDISPDFINAITY